MTAHPRAAGRGVPAFVVLRALVGLAIAVTILLCLFALLVIAADIASQGEDFDGLGTFLGLLFLCGAVPTLGVLVLDLRLLRRRPRAGAWLTLAIGAGITLLGLVAGTQIADWLLAVPVGLLVSGLAVWALRSQ